MVATCAMAGRRVRKLAFPAVTILGMSSYYLAFAVTPLLTGDAILAGHANGAMMLAAIVAELLTPWTLRRLGARSTLALGLLLLGIPAFLLLGADSGMTLILVSMLRGCGFGLTVVVLGVMAAGSARPGGRGAALGHYGLFASVPSILALPSGVWLAQEFGVGVVLAAAGILAVVPVAICGALASGHGASEPEQPVGDAGLALPVLIAFTVAALASGAIATFAVVLVADPWLAPPTLFIIAVASTIVRWLAGHAGDRQGHVPVLLAALLTCAAGLLLLALGSNVAAVLIGAAIFGSGFGAAQTASLVLLMAGGASASHHARASAAWNLAYDLGYAASAISLGSFVGSWATEVLVTLSGVAALTVLPWISPRLRQLAAR